MGAAGVLNLDRVLGLARRWLRAPVDAGIAGRALVVASSPRNRTAPANAIVQRLTNVSSSDRLARAFAALGQIVNQSSFFAILMTKRCRIPCNSSLAMASVATI